MNWLTSIREALDGYKTYIGLIALGLLGIAVAQGWVTDEMAATLGAAITAFTGVAIKHSWDKAQKAKPPSLGITSAEDVKTMFEQQSENPN